MYLNFILKVLRDRKKKNKAILLASDHAGFVLKESIKKFLRKRGSKVIDLGRKNTNSVDYPFFAHLLFFYKGKPWEN